MRLEKSISSEELDEDASYTPDVARERPAKAKDDLRGTVMPGRDHRRMIFILECRRSEINQPDLGVQENPPLVGLSIL